MIGMSESVKVRRPVREAVVGVQARADGGLNQAVTLEMMKTGQI